MNDLNLTHVTTTHVADTTITTVAHTFIAAGVTMTKPYTVIANANGHDIIVDPKGVQHDANTMSLRDDCAQVLDYLANEVW